MGEISNGPTGWSDDRFTDLVEENFDDIWRYARYRCGSDADADDFVANVLAVAWRRRADMPEPPATRLWLFGVAKRVLSDQRRTSRRKNNLQTKLRLVRSEDRYEITERSDDLWVALSKLNSDDREILLLKAWDGLAVSEMAAIFECTPNAMSLRLSKTRTKLADEIQKLSKKDLGTPGHVTVDPKFRKENHG